MVGAGGIGSEMVKNFLHLNIGYLHIIDLDVIEITNLNR